MIACLPVYAQRIGNVLTSLVLLCCTVLPAYSQNDKLSGTWTGTYRLQNNLDFRTTLNLVHNGNSLTGSMKLYSDVDSNFVVYQIDGLIKGDSITLNDAIVLKHNSVKPNYWCKKIIKGILSSRNDSLIITADALPTGFGIGPSNVMKPVTDCRPATLRIIKTIASNVQIVQPLVIQPARSRVQPARLAITDRGIIDQDRISIRYNGKPLLDINGRPLTDVLITAVPSYADVVISAQAENKLEVISVSSGRSETSTVLISFWNKNTRQYQHYPVNCSPGKSATIFLKPE